MIVKCPTMCPKRPATPEIICNFLNPARISFKFSNILAKNMHACWGKECLNTLKIEDTMNRRTKCLFGNICLKDWAYLLC